MDESYAAQVRRPTQTVALPKERRGNRRDRPLRVLADVRSLIETMPLEKAGEAYSRMRSGEARFRMVLTMKAAR